MPDLRDENRGRAVEAERGAGLRGWQFGITEAQGRFWASSDGAALMAGRAKHASQTASVAAEESAQLAEPNRQEKALVQRAGRIYAVSDLLWIAQAALLSFAVAGFVVGPTGHLIPLILAAAGFIALAAVRSSLNVYAAKLARDGSRKLMSRVRQSLLDIIAASSPATPMPSSGHVAAMLNEQVSALGPYFHNYYPQMIRVKIVPLGIVAASACISWLVAVILLVTGPVIPLFMALIGIRAKAASADQQEELARMSGFLLDRVRGLETLRLFGAVKRTEEQIGSVGDSFRRGTMRVLRVAFLSSTVLELFSALGIAFTAVYVGFFLLGDFSIGTWTGSLSFGAGLFVLLLAPEFFAPLRSFAAAYHDRAAGLAAKEKLQELYQSIQGSADPSDKPIVIRPEDCPLVNQPADRPFRPHIEFNNVTISLGGRTILAGFSLNIAPGDTILLTGPSGAGKTTLLDCVLGLHRPDTGLIRVDGHKMQDLNLARWRQEICWIGQAPRLFHGSVRSNLLRADPAAAREQMWEALRLAGAAAFVESLPRGLDTVIGEDGFGLSVGEGRRIALARAALRKDAGVIVADEPTAGLDAETAADVIAGLQAISKGRTLIMATHDPKLMKLPGKTIRLASSRVGEVVA